MMGDNSSGWRKDVVSESAPCHQNLRQHSVPKTARIHSSFRRGDVSQGATGAGMAGTMRQIRFFLKSH